MSERGQIRAAYIGAGGAVLAALIGAVALVVAGTGVGRAPAAPSTSTPSPTPSPATGPASNQTSGPASSTASGPAPSTVGKPAGSPAPHRSGTTAPAPPVETIVIGVSKYVDVDQRPMLVSPDYNSHVGWDFQFEDFGTVDARGGASFAPLTATDPQCRDTATFSTGQFHVPPGSTVEMCGLSSQGRLFQLRVSYDEAKRYTIALTRLTPQ